MEVHFYDILLVTSMSKHTVWRFLHVLALDTAGRMMLESHIQVHRNVCVYVPE